MIENSMRVCMPNSMTAPCIDHVSPLAPQQPVSHREDWVEDRGRRLSHHRPVPSPQMSGTEGPPFLKRLLTANPADHAEH
jgi:hypothetical protein